MILPRGCKVRFWRIDNRGFFPALEHRRDLELINCPGEWAEGTYDGPCNEPGRVLIKWRHFRLPIGLDRIVLPAGHGVIPT